MNLWVLLLAIIVVGAAFAVVSAARQKAKAEPATHSCCAPCPHTCHLKHR